MDKKRPAHIPDKFASFQNKLKSMSREQVRGLLFSDPNNYPEKVYKYYSNEVKEEFLRCVLIDSDFYLSSPTSFNDPFDTTARVKKDFPVGSLRKKIKSVVIKNYPKFSQNRVNDEVNNLMVEHKENPNRIKNLLKDMLSLIGVSCFSKTHKNILMWSHYANHHKGIVLEFDVIEDPATLSNLLEIDYSEDYPDYDYLSSNQKESYMKILTTKSKSWKYEEEWRMIHLDAAENYQKFEPSALTSVIFGCRAEKEFKLIVQSILKEREESGLPKVKTFNAVMDDSSYNLKFEETC